MLAKRTTIYPLLAIVLVVWGVIAYRLFSPAEDVRAARPITRPPTQQKFTVSDTLLANYRDPFLQGASENAEQPHSVVLQPQAASTKPREKTTILWLGLIRGPQKVYYLISLDGRQHMIRPGERAEGFALERVSEDSIVLTKQTYTYTVKRP